MPSPPPAICAPQPPVANETATNELTRILASLVVTLAEESEHV
jgi:hypothetical protein